MKHSNTLIALLVLLVLSSQALFAFEFDAQRWQRDLRTLKRMEKLSKNLRANFRNFAKEHGAAEEITGEQHALADKTIAAYAKIRNYLGVIGERWSEAVPSRPTIVEKVDERLKGGALSLAAEAIQLENANVMVSCFKGTIWEKRLNQGAPDRSKWHVEGLFRDIVRTLGSSSHKRQLLHTIEYINSNSDSMETLASRDKELIDLLDIVIASTVIEGMEEESFFGRLGDDIATRVSTIGSKSKEGVDWLIGKISKLVGNTAGSIHIGKATVSGEVRSTVYNEMMSVLQPGDVLLDKTRFALTDKLIPGHFGHVALWLGTGVEMEDCGLFNSKDNRQSWRRAGEYRDKLLTGSSVLEALRPGVQVNTLEHFLKVDVVAIIRWKEATPEKIAPVLYRGLYHLGQDYDFNFDVNSSNTIVCSELVYQAFPETINWQTDEALGRPTISPDAVAQNAGFGAELPFEVIYYHDSGNSYWGEEATKVYLEAMAAVN